jgi:dihydroorotase
MESCHKKTEQDRLIIKRCLTTELTSSPRTIAPHTLEEKETLFSIYVRRPDGSALLNCMLEFYKQELISLEKIVEKCANPAILYRMTNRGFIREGYFADLTLVDLNSQWTVAKENLLYKCGWSPLKAPP